MFNSRNRTKNIDVSDIRKKLAETDVLHDKVSEDLEKAKTNTDQARDTVNEVIQRG